MLEWVIFDAGETEGAGRIEAHGLEIAGDDFHRGDAAIRHRSEKAVTVGKGGARTPEAEPRGVAQIFGLRRTGGRFIDDAGARPRILKADPGKARFGTLGPPITDLDRKNVG